MDGKRGCALITGAASGIGRAVARRLAQKGWRIAALDLESAGLQSLKHELNNEHLDCEWRRADVADAADVRAGVEGLESQLGPVDLMVACAGIADATPAVSMDAEHIAKVIRINLLGVSNTIAAVLSGMLERKRGHLVAISSLASLRGLPGQMAYCASKAGLNVLMESLRFDVQGQGIYVTTVCPGWTRTPLTTGKYHDSHLMGVEGTARGIIAAIERRARFHAFPRRLVWQLRLLNLLPGWLQDRLVLRRIRKLRKSKECTDKGQGPSAEK